MKTLRYCFVRDASSACLFCDESSAHAKENHLKEVTSHTERVIRENAEFLRDPEILEKLLECSDLTTLHAVYHLNCYINFKNRVTVRKLYRQRRKK